MNDSPSGGPRTEPPLQALPAKSFSKFCSSFAATLDLGQKVETGRPIQVRRYLMSITDYWLYFRVKKGVVEVLSVWGTHRGSGPKL
ncbi:MAG: hypothetical protein QM750_09800 [Rubrivivax sp.]